MLAASKAGAVKRRGNVRGFSYPSAMYSRLPGRGAIIVIVVADPGETTDDLVRDMMEVLTSMCARLYGRRGARNRAMRAVTATKTAEPEPEAV